MSSAHPDRIKLATGATTIIRVPIARGKSATGTAAFWAALPELNSRDQLDRNGGGNIQEQQQQHQDHAPAGMPPIPGAGPVPWRDAVTSNSTKSLHLPSGAGADSKSRRRLLFGGGQPSTKSMTGIGGGGGGGAVSFRRNGVASAPVVSSAAVAAGGGGAAANSARLLPAINAGSRSAAASASGAAASAASPPPPPPVPGIAALPSAIRGVLRRSIVSLPSIKGDASAASASGAGGGGAAGKGESTGDEDPPPIVVSFAPSRPGSGGRADTALRRGLSRPAVRVMVNGVVVGTTDGAAGGESGGGGGETSGGNDEASTSDFAAAATTGNGGGGGGLLRGIRRLFGKEGSSINAAAASLAAAATADGGAGGGADAAAATTTASGGSDDTIRQDDTASSSLVHVQRSSTSIAQLTYEYVREQERVNRIRSSLLGMDPRGSAPAPPVVAVRQSGAGATAAAGGDVSAPAPLAGELSGRSVEPGELRSLGRSGKSFTQRAMEDPNSPAFKAAKALAAVQDKLSYMESRSWRERAAELANMERPILMAEGWKL